MPIKKPPQPRRRLAILEISRTLIEDYTLANASVAEVLDALHIPAQFTPKESYADWDTASLKIRLESDLLPEVGKDQLIPYISFTFQDGKAVGFTLTRREVIYYEPELFPIP